MKKVPLWDFEAGEVLLVNKLKTWTSFDVVHKIRNSIGRIKVGHAGTLDPMATGLLIICAGKMTKQIDQFQAQVKEYTGTILLGKTTPSYDSETEPNVVFDIANVTFAEINSVIPKFLGEIQQIPPIYSAIKKDGVRLYEHARKGTEVEIVSRKVTIFELEFNEIRLPEIHFRVVCSKGTYIRSLANDIGKALGLGAYLLDLRRTKIGEYKIEDAWEIDDLCKEIKFQKELKFDVKE